MKIKTIWLLSMLTLLFLANVLMLLGWTNYQASISEDFTEHFLGSAPTGKDYEPIGKYDNLTKKPEHGQSEWRGPSPNEPLKGPAVNPGPDSLFIFANNQCKPECCGASYSCGNGCVCTTPEQRQMINGRGGNNSAGGATV